MMAPAQILGSLKIEAGASQPRRISLPAAVWVVEANADLHLCDEVALVALVERGHRWPQPLA